MHVVIKIESKIKMKIKIKIKTVSASFWILDFGSLSGFLETIFFSACLLLIEKNKRFIIKI
jgi:hypothetical protein